VSLSPRLTLLLTLPPLLWAGNAIIGRLMVGHVPPLTLNLLRWTVAALFLAPWAWRALTPWKRLQSRWPYLFMASLLGVGCFNALQYLALVSSSAINVTLVNSSLSVWMLVIGAWVYRSPVSRRQWLGALLGLLGVALVVSRGSWEVLTHLKLVPGDLLTLAAIIGWAFYSWMLARPPAHMQGDQRPNWNWAEFLFIQTCFGLLGAGSFALGEQALGAQPIEWNGQLLAVLLYISLGASILAYRCWGLGVAEGGPALAAVFNNLTPLFAASLSALFLGESPRAYHALAFVLIAGGILVSLPRKARG
jgi:drug/metabolite transporter (DMT)-like permease